MEEPPHIAELVADIEESVTRMYHHEIKLAVRRKMAEAMEYRAQLREEPRNGPYMWITVNAKPGVDPEQLLKACKKAFTKSWCKHSIWAIEQRAEEPPYTGFHVHAIVFKDTKPPYDSKRGMKSTLKKVCNVDNKSTLYIRFYDEPDAKEKVLYLLGIKQDKKMAKVNADILFRENLGIPPYFTHNVIPESLLESQQ